jgi:predicted AAA+ superfamily ATPase
MKNFIRQTYIDQIEPYIDIPIIKVLTGQRRIGKSFIMLQLIDLIKQKTPNPNIIYINKEEFEFDFIKDYTDLYNFIISKSIDQKNYVFIDEIQEITEFEKAIRSLLQAGNYDIYCTGSNANMLSSDLATLLSGRYIEIIIHSLTYLEFIEFHSLENTQNSLETYLKRGGLPFLIHLPNDDKIVFDYLKNIYNTIFFKDIISRFNIRNVAFLNDLTKYLANNCGSIFSGNSIEKYLKAQKIKVSHDIIINYLDYLQKAFFIHRVKREDINGKKIFEIGEKIFFEDLGLRNSLVGYNTNDIHKIMENAIYNQLLYKGFEVTVGVLNSTEIDFIAKKNNETIYIQVCLSLDDIKTSEREYGNLIKIQDNYDKIVISMNKINILNTYKGIKHFSLLEFLNK